MEEDQKKETCGRCDREKIDGKCPACGAPQLFTSVEKVERIGMEYINSCKEKGEPILVTGLALALKTTRKTLKVYENNPKFGYTIKMLKQHCENFAEYQLYTGKNPSGAIFALKNYDWKDTQEVDNNIKGSISLSSLHDAASKSE